MISLDNRKTTLEARLAYLNGKLLEIEHDLDQEPTRDFEDYATEHEDDEVLERLGTAGQQEIRAIKAALDRIARGEYGICRKCRADILPARLDVLPYTPICKECARKAQYA